METTSFKARLTEGISLQDRLGKVTEYPTGTAVDMSRDYVDGLEAFDTDLCPVAHGDSIFVAYLGKHSVILTTDQFEPAD